MSKKFISIQESSTVTDNKVSISNVTIGEYAVAKHDNSLVGTWNATKGWVSKDVIQKYGTGSFQIDMTVRFGESKSQIIELLVQRVDFISESDTYKYMSFEYYDADSKSWRHLVVEGADAPTSGGVYQFIITGGADIDNLQFGGFIREYFTKQ